jgi:AraC-like DNA-binding protein
MPPMVTRRQASSGSQTHQDELRAHGALPADLKRALEWLRRNPDSEVGLEALSAVAGVRPRTLEEHFKQVLGTTPLGWVRTTRLAKARQALLGADDRTTVTGVALASGFNQLGRFAGTYRRRFGELPSETLKMRRSGVAEVSDGYDDEAVLLAWRALPAAFAVAPGSNAIALEQLERAQEIAPDFGFVRGMAAWCWAQRAAQHFGSSPKADIARSNELLGQALVKSPDDPMTLVFASGALTLAHRVEEADQLLERALVLDPGSPAAWVRRGWASAYLGDGQTALRELRTTLHLAPFEPIRHLAFIGMGCAHFAEGHYERAARWVESGVEAGPQSFWAERVVIAAAVHAGARAEARRRAQQLMRKDPNLTVSIARQAWPFRPDFMNRLCQGLEIAGIPRA